ncbi:MAG: RsmD family RNA methyltransferase [Prevotella sp.]|nr:RsmD family RNA methyltransferase [Prevotella sp.]
MRVITGKYKGRRFDVPRTFKARPTTDFAKENLFNVLGGYIDLDGAACLDLFAGTGSITLEMLSRGAAEATIVEADREHAAFIRACLAKLGECSCRLVCGDVFRFIRACKEQYDLIFADPPYRLPGIDTLPDLVLFGGLLAKDGVFVLEHGKENTFEQHSRFAEHRRYGSVNFSIFR